MKVCLCAIIVVLSASEFACKRDQPHDEKTTPKPTLDLSAVYRAHKELQTAFLAKVPPPELEKPTVMLKTEVSILQDRISYDHRPQTFSSIVEAYGQIASWYETYEATMRVRRQHIDCIFRHDAYSNICDSRYKPQEDKLYRKLASIGPITALENEATSEYMQLTGTSKPLPQLTGTGR